MAAGYRPSAFLMICAISRAYSLPYVALFGVCGMLTGTAAISPIAAGLGMLIPLALGVGIASLNDLRHAPADRLAGRARAYSPRFLLLLGGIGTTTALLAALSGGVWVVSGVLGSVCFGVVYGMLKAIPGLANLARGLTSSALAIGLAALNHAPAEVLPLAIGVGLLDAAGNIWGDFRDRVGDMRANVRTLVVRNPQAARRLAYGLHLVATMCFVWYTPLVLPLLLGSGLAAQAAERRMHLIFLLVKYTTCGVIGLALAQTPLEFALVCGLTLMALPAAQVYRAIHEQGLQA